MIRLDGQVAVVTGGARGIGRAIAERFAGAGASVMACGRGERPSDLPGAIDWTVCDVSRVADVQALRQATEERLGRATLLVNNAGVQVEKTVVESSDDDWDLVMSANARGVFNTCRAFIPGMEAAGGVIVNIGSISGDVSDPGMALYNASKSFVHGLTRSIAVDHGPMVRCNAIKPGWIMTGMADAAFALAGDPQAARADALNRHPVRRFGEPDDIAEAALWLTSDHARFVTGQCITVDGGLTSASPLQPGLFP